MILHKLTVSNFASWILFVKIFAPSLVTGILTLYPEVEMALLQEDPILFITFHIFMENWTTLAK